MSVKFRAVLATATLGLSALGLSTPALATTHPAPRHSAKVTEDSPSWNCRTMGNRVCGTPRLRVLVAKLASRPALILPGQWQTPKGTVLVRECFDSYPGVNGRPTAELIDCLGQPDPRKSDRRVMTLHQYHVNHVNHTR